jgi:hypothetical protein
LLRHGLSCCCACTQVFCAVAQWQYYLLGNGSRRHSNRGATSGHLRPPFPERMLQPWLSRSFSVGDCVHAIVTMLQVYQYAPYIIHVLPSLLRRDGRGLGRVTANNLLALPETGELVSGDTVACQHVSSALNSVSMTHKWRSTLSSVMTHMRMQPPDEPSRAIASARAKRKEKKKVSVALNGVRCNSTHCS